MVNYQNAKVYKIVDNTNGNIYVGSTCESTLARRLAGHVKNYNLYLKGKCNYVTSYEIIKNNDYEIVLLENCPCESKDQLKARERYYIESLDCVNKVIIGRTQKEYQRDNQEKIKKHKKEYYQQNKEIINEAQQQYYKSNKNQYSLLKLEEDRIKMQQRIQQELNYLLSIET